eukprot:6187563-Pleurochrysis_carterae.AAC.5
MATSFVVWGANTNIGKTLLSAGIMRTVARLSPPIGSLYLKPVQTGAPDSDGALVAQLSGLSHTIGEHASASRLGAVCESRWTSAQEAEAINIKTSSAALLSRTLFAWNDAVSPHLAVEREGRPVSDELVLQSTRDELAYFKALGGRCACLQSSAKSTSAFDKLPR